MPGHHLSFRPDFCYQVRNSRRDIARRHLFIRLLTCAVIVNKVEQLVVDFQNLHDQNMHDQNQHDQAYDGAVNVARKTSCLAAERVHHEEMCSNTVVASGKGGSKASSQSWCLRPVARRSWPITGHNVLIVVMDTLCSHNSTLVVRIDVLIVVMDTLCS